jgi:hypothetical protein
MSWQLEQETRLSFTQEVFWEFAQNLPIVTSFFAALQLWQQGQQVAAIACSGIGGVAGALNIRAVERRFKGNAEPLRVTIANVLIMPLLMLAFVLYLSAGWSNWRTDLLAGTLAGVGLGAAQGLAIQGPIDVVRCAAFACAFPLTIVSTRVLVSAAPAPISVLASTTIVTLMICLIDYGFSRPDPDKPEPKGTQSTQRSHRDAPRD